MSCTPRILCPTEMDKVELRCRWKIGCMNQVHPLVSGDIRQCAPDEGNEASCGLIHEGVGISINPFFVCLLTLERCRIAHGIKHVLHDVVKTLEVLQDRTLRLHMLRLRLDGRLLAFDSSSQEAKLSRDADNDSTTDHDLQTHLHPGIDVLRGHRQRPSHWWVLGFICPVQVCPGGGVTVVSQRCSVRFQVEVALVPSSHSVCRRPMVFSS